MSEHVDHLVEHRLVRPVRARDRDVLRGQRDELAQSSARVAHERRLGDAGAWTADGTPIDDDVGGRRGPFVVDTLRLSRVLAAGSKPAGIPQYRGSSERTS
jgi:hypothetical protein